MLKTLSISTKNFFEKASKKVLIAEDRKNHLLKIAETIAKEYAKKEVVNLTFICSHNSRRSQLAQVWGFFAASYFKLNIHSFSGGIEVTSFNRSSIKTLQKAGFYFQLSDFSHQNPKYEISFDGTKRYIIGYSKLIEHPENPSNFIAITTCSNVDANCAYIGANYCFQLPIEDPKHSDGTLLQEERYMEINRQIAGEIGIIFSEVKKQLSLLLM
jgi:arsenate reductase